MIFNAYVIDNINKDFIYSYAIRGMKPDHKRIIETKDYEHTMAKSLTLYSPNSYPNPK